MSPYREVVKVKRISMYDPNIGTALSEPELDIES